MPNMTNHTKRLLKKHWASYGLETAVLQEILELHSEELRCARKWKKNLLQYSVEWATNLACSLAEKWHKPVPHYLNMALKNKWITHFYSCMNR